MKTKKSIFFKLFLAAILLAQIPFSSAVAAQAWPTRPADLVDPGSANYSHQLFHETLTINGRSVEFYAPADFKSSSQKLSVTVFGHGQAISIDGYKETCEHLAKKGVAVIFPQYDSGFFDQNWLRMASDYVSLTAEIFKKYQPYLDSQKIVFSGHSKGGYVGLIAAGLPENQLLVKPAAVVLFAPAGYDAGALNRINAGVPVTLIWGDQDTIIKKSLVQEIYSKLLVKNKQFIQVNSYKDMTPSLPADHYFPMSKKYFFGGVDGVIPYHYFGSYKWLLGATSDLENGGQLNNPFIYGQEASSSGLANQKHTITRSW